MQREVRAMLDPMQWTVAEMHELARAIAMAGDSFKVRRMLQRLERGEVTIPFATESLSMPADITHEILRQPPDPSVKVWRYVAFTK
jgi:hypothetical protein